MPLPFDEFNNTFVYPYKATLETFYMLGGSDNLTIIGTNIAVVGDYAVLNTLEDGPVVVLDDDFIRIESDPADFIDPAGFGEDDIENNVAIGDCEVILIGGEGVTSIVTAGDDYFEIVGANATAVGDADLVTLSGWAGSTVLKFFGGDDVILAEELGDEPGLFIGDTVETVIECFNSDAFIEVAFGDDAIAVDGGRIYGDSQELVIEVFEGSDDGLVIDCGDDILLAWVDDSLIVGDVHTVSQDIDLETGKAIFLMAGNDHITSGSGNDTMYGDFLEFVDTDGDVSETPADPILYIPGSDTFVFGQGENGNDVIMDFEVGADTISMSSTFTDISFFVGGDGTLITYQSETSGLNSLLLDGVFETEIEISFF